MGHCRSDDSDISFMLPEVILECICFDDIFDHTSHFFACLSVISENHQLFFFVHPTELRHQRSYISLSTFLCPSVFTQPYHFILPQKHYPYIPLTCQSSLGDGRLSGWKLALSSMPKSVANA
ncbi:hypothetical protein DdX_12607 [Ditylenchus destructor]|uniref:Uncharacterized protein n=1 Tax=Ditylenchus destructor TaxID=166010 RepID=A0AAD4QX96_9BILA|nr:hypothetical protein DdX_12607 [Ditylenchus destructor]